MKSSPYDAPNRLRFVKVLGVCVSLLVIYGVYLSRANLHSFESWYVREDGLIEWLTVLGLLSASFICFYRIPVLRPFRSRFFLFCLFIQGGIFLFGAAEEISWGQRIFNTESSSFFQQYNSQGETNIHNLVLGGKSVNRLLFGTVLGIFIACYFILLPIAYKKVDKIKLWVNDLALPLPHFYHLGFYLALFLVTRFTNGMRGGELLEFSGVWVFVMVLLVPYNSVAFSRRLINR